MGDIKVETIIRTRKSKCSAFKNIKKISKSSIKRKTEDELTSSETDIDSSNKKRRSSRLQQNSAVKLMAKTSKKQDKMEDLPDGKLSNSKENVEYSTSLLRENMEMLDDGVENKIDENTHLSVENEFEITAEVKTTLDIIIDEICTTYDFNDADVTNKELVCLEDSKSQVKGNNLKTQLVKRNLELFSEDLLKNGKENSGKKGEETSGIIQNNIADLSLTKITELKVIETIFELNTIAQNNLDKCNLNAKLKNCEDHKLVSQQIKESGNDSNNKMQVEAKYIRQIENNIVAEEKEQMMLHQENKANISFENQNDVPDNKILQSYSNTSMQNEVMQCFHRIEFLIPDDGIKDVNFNDKQDKDFSNNSVSSKLDLPIHADMDKLIKPTFKKKKSDGARWVIPIKSESAMRSSNRLKTDLTIPYMSALEYQNRRETQDETSTSKEKINIKNVTLLPNTDFVQTNKQSISLLVSNESNDFTGDSALDLECWKISSKNIEESYSSNSCTEINDIHPETINENEMNLKSVNSDGDVFFQQIIIQENDKTAVNNKRKYTMEEISTTPEVNYNCVNQGATNGCQVSEYCHDQQLKNVINETLFPNHQNLKGKDTTTKHCNYQDQRNDITIETNFHNDNEKTVSTDVYEKRNIHEGGVEIAAYCLHDKEKIKNRDISRKGDFNEDGVTVTTHCDNNHGKINGIDVSENKSLITDGLKIIVDNQSGHEKNVSRNVSVNQELNRLNDKPQVKPNINFDFWTEGDSFKYSKRNICLNQQMNETKLNVKEDNMMKEIIENLKYGTSFTLITPTESFNVNRDVELYEKYDICKKFSDSEENIKTRISTTDNSSFDSLITDSQIEANQFQETQEHLSKENILDTNIFSKGNAYQKETNESQQNREANKDNCKDIEDTKNSKESAELKDQELKCETEDNLKPEKTETTTDLDESMNLDDDFLLTASQLSMLEADEKARSCSLNITQSVGSQTDVIIASYIEKNELMKEVMDQLHYLREAIDCIKVKMDAS